MSGLRLVAQRHLVHPAAGVLNLVLQERSGERHLVWRARDGSPSRVIPIPAANVAWSADDLLDLGAHALATIDAP